MKNNVRGQQGNMLALIAAFTILMLALLFFALSYTRLLGASAEQKTAIEAAALAAARDCSRIVVNNAECGWVSLSDFAPSNTSNYTDAVDGYPLPVRSINTVIGTARLDLIIADKLGQTIMKDLAKKDMQNALLAKDQLTSALNAAILPSGSGRDKDGNTVTPYASAVAAYQQNAIRMTDSANYVAGSMQLDLGWIQGGNRTAIPLPKPTAQHAVAPALKIGNCYRSYVNIPYDGVDFVFGGIGDSISIVDPKLFRTGPSGLPYEIPTIVRAQANELVKDIHKPSGYTMRAVACAQPATVHDPLPFPGALSISCPDGRPPEITRPLDLYMHPKMNGSSAPSANDVQMLTAQVGDYPTDSGSNMTPMNWPLGGGSSVRLPSEVWRVALYDWIRRAGTKADIQSIINMQNTALANPTPLNFTWIAPVNLTPPQYAALGSIPAGVIHIFSFDSSGSVWYEWKPQTPLPLYASSNEQMHGEALPGIIDSAASIVTINLPTVGSLNGGKMRLLDDYDIYYRDEVRQPGTTKGGKHAGEPIAKPILVTTTPTPASANQTAYLLGNPIVVNGHGANCPNNVTATVTNAGFPPMVQPRNDFGYTFNPSTSVVATMPGGSASVRPFYQSVGTAVDIRFRRIVDVSEAVGTPGQFGYVTDVNGGTAPN
jgi:hypothetical protein